MMRLAVITQEKFIGNEALIINRLFDAGLLLLHLRKPQSTKGETEKLLKQISVEYYNRVVLHDHFSLLDQFPLKGVHLNSRNPEFGKKGYSVSKSCHTIEEIEISADKFDYIFLSPVFNSISKKGYTGKFNPNEISEARNKGIINEKVFALGGIDISNINIVKHYGFGGVGVLGAVWSNLDSDGIIGKYKELVKLCNSF